MILKLWQHSFEWSIIIDIFNSQIIKMKIFILFLLQMELSLVTTELIHQLSYFIFGKNAGYI